MYKKQGKSGFTLIEMMVSVSIFAIVAVIATGAFVVLSDVFRKAQSTRAVVDNLTFAMDTLTLQIREGQDYLFETEDRCGLPASDNCYEKITFHEFVIEDGVQIPFRELQYYVDAGRIVQRQAFLSSDGEPLPGHGEPILTSSEISIRNFKFYTNNSTGPRRILLLIDGIAINIAGLETDFTLQTTLAQRNF